MVPKVLFGMFSDHGFHDLIEEQRILKHILVDVLTAANLKSRFERENMPTKASPIDIGRHDSSRRAAYESRQTSIGFRIFRKERQPRLTRARLIDDETYCFITQESLAHGAIGITLLISLNPIQSNGGATLSHKLIDTF